MTHNEHQSFWPVFKLDSCIFGTEGTLAQLLAGLAGMAATSSSWGIHYTEEEFTVSARPAGFGWSLRRSDTALWRSTFLSRKRVSMSGAGGAAYFERVKSAVASLPFGYCLSRLAREVTLYTFDSDPRCVSAVDLLNRSQTSVRAVFASGAAKQTLTGLVEADIELAWIHGDPDFDTAVSDIEHAMRLKVKTILVNDTKIVPAVKLAAATALTMHPEYSNPITPLAQYDAHGLLVLRRV